MKVIKLHEVTEAEYPLKVDAYETDEGNNGFAIFTQDGCKVELCNGSYGYDTFFFTNEEATKTCDYLNRMIASFCGIGRGA